ncbi:MAG: DUF2723 domain-containing protein [Bacteroidota bacterium]
MRNFRLLNNLTAWLVFGVAAYVYTHTVEPTASFWDCGEFIATAYKLQVPHPPGAPFFLLTYRLFSFLALGDVTQVAFWMNITSALCSAFTILFLFWTITLLGRKMMRTPTEPTKAQTLGLLSAGVVGALAYTFSDSFWFSATETEVYAMSSLFTAFVVWATLKWELIEEENTSLRWLLLIAYVMGLSIGVHLLNLVTVPALALLFYFKRYQPTLRGGLLTFTIGIAIIFLVMLGVRIVLPTLAGEFELIAVNSLGLPFGAGIIGFLVLFLGALIYGIRYSIRQQKVWLNTALLAFAFVLIGYSSYTVAIIRSGHNPPINENEPDDVLSIVYYLSLKQYPTRPLLYGPHFTAPYIDQEEGGPIYIKGEDKYEVADHDRNLVYDPRHQTLLPRMYSKDPAHVATYRQLMGLPEGKKPSLADNFRYMFSHQLGFQYGRYFMWNFAGRESDRQGASWLASLSNENLPPALAENAGHNNYWMLPLLLGILGLGFQYQRNLQGFLFTLLLFFMMGAALVLYLNTPPTEPRERDYIYVGSYYAFAIWIGLGVIALATGINYLIKNKLIGTTIAAVACLTVPGIMADQGWDDHDRSNRYVAVDTAKNMLNSCAPNAILLTNGDNDTFPLWYAQEVEGFRTDVRVVISGYLNFDWYVSQMKRKVYQSDPLPISLQEKNYRTGTNNQLVFVENPQVKDGISLPEYLNLLRSDSPALKVPLQNGETINMLPSAHLVLPINKAAVRKQGILALELQGLLTDTMEFTLNKEDMMKGDLIFLDILSTNQWKRPIYFSSMMNAAKFNLTEYTQIEGTVYRLLPVKVPGASQGYINSTVMYDNLMKKSVWRELDNAHVYYDEEASDQHVFPSRLAFYLLASQLIREGKPEKAREVMLHCLKVMPDRGIPFDRADSAMIEPLLEVGETTKAMEIAQVMAKRADANLAYYLDSKGAYTHSREIQDNLSILNDVVVALKKTNQPETGQYEALFNRHLNKWKN